MSWRWAGGTSRTMRSLPVTMKYRSRPVMKRLMRVWRHEAVGPPTEAEKRDAIRVLSFNYQADHPRNDPLYAEAERIFMEAGE